VALLSRLSCLWRAVFRWVRIRPGNLCQSTTGKVRCWDNPIDRFWPFPRIGERLLTRQKHQTAKTQTGPPPAMEAFGRALSAQHEVYSVVNLSESQSILAFLLTRARITPMTRRKPSPVVPHGKEIFVSILVREFFGNQCSTVMHSQALTQQSPRHVINKNSMLEANKRSHNAEVGGSSPSVATHNIKHLYHPWEHAITVSSGVFRESGTSRASIKSAIVSGGVKMD